MQIHTTIYFKSLGFAFCDAIYCERCGAVAVDIHHIHGRGKGKNNVNNLMALCRDCHTTAHSTRSKDEFQRIHSRFLLARNIKDVREGSDRHITGVTLPL